MAGRQSRYDVAVAGAGPAGSYAAFRLTQAGARVAVLDPKDSPGRDVCCTGIVSAECYHRFIEGTGVKGLPARAASLLGPGGHRLRVASDATQAYIVDRPELNRALAARAEAAGARYFLGCRVIDIVRTSSGCQVVFDRGRSRDRLHASAVVVASGFTSGLPARLGLGRVSYCATAAQARVETKANEVEIYLDQERAPGGFAWLVPTGDGAGLAGIVTRRRAASFLTAFLTDLKAQDRIATGAVAISRKAIPLGMLSRTYTDGALVLGEAAGQVKPTTCGGVYTGLLCAEVAAETLREALAAGDVSANRLAAYERGWRSLIAADLARGYWLRRLYDGLTQEQIERLFRGMAAGRVLEQAVGRADFSFDWHARLFARLLRRPGVVGALLAPRTLFSLPVLMTLVKSFR